MAAHDQRSRASAVPVRLATSAGSRIVSWTLRVATAAALGIDATVHLQNASGYDGGGATITEGELFRVEAGLAIAVGLIVLLWPRRISWIAALLVGASALAAVLAYRYVDIGPVGPFPDMYENTWQVPGKVLSAYAEGAAVLLAGLGLLVYDGRAGGTRTHEVLSPQGGRNMPATPLSKILYIAEAVTEGGRAGHGRTSDGRLDLELSVPGDMGGQGGPGTNPEQLFALGYAACFQSALLAVAQGRHLDASDAQITARVGIGPTGHGGYGRQVALDLHAPQLSPTEAADLMTRADQYCPYSNATRGNVEVALSVEGASIERTAA